MEGNHVLKIPPRPNIMLVILIHVQVYIESQRKPNLITIEIPQFEFYFWIISDSVNCEWSEWEVVQSCNNTCRAGSIRWNRTVVVEAESGGDCFEYYGGSVEGKNGTIDTSWSYCNMHECPGTIHTSIEFSIRLIWIKSNQVL